MSYVDAHIHLADPGYKGQIDAVLEDAAQNGVAHLLSNAVDYETSLQTIALAKQHQGLVLAAVGLHPSTVVSKGNSEQTKFESLLDEHRQYVSAIGEIGLDGKYTQDQDKVKLQRETFRFFLGVAEKGQLPVVVHSRSAVSEVFDELSRFNLPRVLLHWYDGPTDTLRLIQDCGYMISVGPSLISSKRIADVARFADLETILTETDGPVSYRGPFEGKRTVPSFVMDVLNRLSYLRFQERTRVREQILSNFHRFLEA